MQKHREEFDKIIGKSMHELKAVFNLVLDGTIKDFKYGRDLALEMLLTKFARDLQRATDRFAHESIDATWKKFDKNHDDVLDEKEMERLVSHLLSELTDNLDKMIEFAMEPAAHNLKEWIESDATGPMGMRHDMGGMGIHMDNDVRKRMTVASQKLKQLLQVLMQALAHDSEPISKEIFDTIDINNDGAVSKQEFLLGFSEAFGSVLDFTKITQILIREREQFDMQLQRPVLQREQSVLIGGDAMPSIVYLSLIVVAAVSLGAFVARRRH